ncbi:MAG: RagB/SusD family nutrient uptake outer membrane protein [Rikenellaceae bacterium]
MNTNKILLAAALSMMSVACSSDFLESTPILATSQIRYYSSDSEMFSALVAAYDPLDFCAVTALTAPVPFGELMSDNANVGCVAESWAEGIQNLEMFNHTNVDEAVQTSWENAYIGIYRTNLVINAEYTSDEAEIYKAEAKFLRAWYHFHAMRRFGPCVISTQAEYPNGYEFVRSSREEVNAQIEADLLDAIDGCEDSFGSDMVGRINKNAARTLLAKHYIYAASWDNNDTSTFSKAIPLLEAVISSGQYQLLPYDTLFGYAGHNNSESIFEIQHSSMSGWSTWSETQDSGEGNFWAMWCSPEGINLHETYREGYGAVCPTQSLYEYYLDDDYVRRDATFLTAEELVCPDGAITAYGAADGEPDPWNTSVYTGLDLEGYAQQKYSGEYIDYTGNVNLNFAVNTRLIRYGEVYLLLAEAYLRGQNNESKAIELMETLRSVHVPGGRTVSEMMSEYPDRFPTVLDVLWYERRCELAGEGDRWYDLVRSQRAGEVMTEFVGELRLQGKTIINWQKYMNYLPLSNAEVSACPTLTKYPDEAGL